MNRIQIITPHIFCVVFLAACSNEHPKLVQAVVDKNYATLKYLLEKGADPDMRTYKTGAGHSAYNENHTALSMAAGRGDERAIKILLRYKADRHKPTRYKKTPFELALEFKYIEAAKLIWEHAPHSGYVPHGNYGLVFSVMREDGDTYQYFRSRLKDERYRRNIYYYFARNSSRDHAPSREAAIRKISFLKERNEKPGPEALIAALRNAHPKLVELLLQAGVDPNARFDASAIDYELLGIKGTTPLMALTSPMYLEAAQAILDGGADINATNSKGQNALMHFVATTFVSARKVIAHEAKGNYGGVPTGFFKVVQLPILEFYLNNGARIDLTDKEGKTILDLINPDDQDAEYKRKYLSQFMGK